MQNRGEKITKLPIISAACTVDIIDTSVCLARSIFSSLHLSMCYVHSFVRINQAVIMVQVSFALAH